MPGAPSSYLLLVVRPGAPSSVLPQLWEWHFDKEKWRTLMAFRAKLASQPMSDTTET